MKPAHATAGAMIAICIALAWTGCSDVEEASGGGSPAKAKLYCESDCGTCVKSSCATELAACDSDPGCTTYFGCLCDCEIDADGVVDAACEAACTPDSSTEAGQAVLNLSSCRAVGPGSECEACVPSESPLPTCEPKTEPPDTPCRACYWDKCCETWDACFLEGVNPDCVALNTCIFDCTGLLEPCVDACFQQHPGAVSTLLAQAECAAHQCAIDTDSCDPAERNACEACVWGGTCGALWAELQSDSEGFLLFMCIGDCGGLEGGVPCLEACFDAHPTAAPAGYLWAECVSYNCDAIC